jgi:hypothetical protein
VTKKMALGMLRKPADLHPKAARFLAVKAVQLGAKLEEVKSAVKRFHPDLIPEIKWSEHEAECELTLYQVKSDETLIKKREPVKRLIFNEAARHWSVVTGERPQMNLNGVFARAITIFTDLVKLPPISEDMLLRQVTGDVRVSETTKEKPKKRPRAMSQWGAPPVAARRRFIHR